MFQACKAFGDHSIHLFPSADPTVFLSAVGALCPFVAPWVQILFIIKKAINKLQKKYSIMGNIILHVHYSKKKQKSDLDCGHLR